MKGIQNQNINEKTKIEILLICRKGLEKKIYTGYKSKWDQLLFYFLLYGHNMPTFTLITGHTDRHVHDYIPLKSCARRLWFTPFNCTLSILIIFIFACDVSWHQSSLQRPVMFQWVQTHCHREGHGIIRFVRIRTDTTHA